MVLNTSNVNEAAASDNNQNQRLKQNVDSEKMVSNDEINLFSLPTIPKKGFDQQTDSSGSGTSDMYKGNV